MENVAEQQIPMIGKIHKVPIYGRLPQSHLETLSKLEQITTPLEWLGIKGIYCTDGIINGVCGSYAAPTKVGSPCSVNFSIGFKNGVGVSLSLDENTVPAIILSSFNDEYAFAINTMHELGHHINREKEKMQNKKEREVGAHLYAMVKISRKEFKLKKEPKFYYWEDARTEYISRFGYDDHVIGEYTLLDFLIEKTNEFKATVKALDWSLPKMIHNKFSKSINYELFEPKKQKKSPWRAETVLN